MAHKALYDLHCPHQLSDLSSLSHSPHSKLSHTVLAGPLAHWAHSCLRAFARAVSSAWCALFPDAIRANASPSFKFYPNVSISVQSSQATLFNTAPPTPTLTPTPTPQAYPMPLPCISILALETDILYVLKIHFASCLLN